MKGKRIQDRISDIIIPILRPFVVLAVRMTFKVKNTGIRISRDRSEPFILIGNHVTTWDAFIACLNINYPIRFVATEVSFLDFMKKISMGYLAQTIRKRVGKTDSRSVKKIFAYLKKGYAIGIYPEGDDTFHGETLDCYKTLGKLFKKANVDIILVKQKGSHLAHPRWADFHASRGKIYTHTELLLTKEEIKELNEYEIQNIVEDAVYHNDYEWQRENMIPYNRKNRAEGIERLIYYCNKCGSILTVYGKKNNIMCKECGVIGTINEYGFIEGSVLDNFVDYNKLQYENIETAINSSFSFNVTLNKVNFSKLNRKRIGNFNVNYKDKALYLSNNRQQFVFDITKVKSPVNTMKNSFSFDYEGESYEFTNIRHQFVLFEMCRYLNGSYKYKQVTSKI